MFEQYAPHSLDTPRELEAFYEIANFGALPLIPFLIAGTSAAAGVTVTSWLGSAWDVGTYNVITSKIDDTIRAWDKQGWTNQCWAKYPVKRNEWLAFWKRWSKHYGQYGKQSVYLSDAAENPVRRIFLPELAQWAEWLNAACKLDVGPGPQPEPTPPANGESPTADIAAIVKWGVIGLGVFLAANIFQMTRGPRPRY